MKKMVVVGRGWGGGIVFFFFLHRKSILSCFGPQHSKKWWWCFFFFFGGGEIIFFMEETMQSNVSCLPPTTELQVESITQQPLHHCASTSTGPEHLKKMSYLLIVTVCIIFALVALICICCIHVTITIYIDLQYPSI